MAPPKLATIDRWSRKYEHCKRCGRNHRSRPPVKHRGRGLCDSCFQAPYVAAWRKKRKQKQKINGKAARKKEKGGCDG